MRAARWPRGDPRLAGVPTERARGSHAGRAPEVGFRAPVRISVVYVGKHRILRSGYAARIWRRQAIRSPGKFTAPGTDGDGISRPLRARLQGRRRPPSRFWILVRRFSMIILLHPRSTRSQESRASRCPCSRWPRCSKARKSTRSDGRGNAGSRSARAPSRSIMQQTTPAEALGSLADAGAANGRGRRAFQMVSSEVSQDAHRLGRLLSVTLYADTCLNASYVDVAVRGQGEETLLELLPALRNGRDFRHIAGISYRDAIGLHVHTKDRGHSLTGRLSPGCRITGCATRKVHRLQTFLAPKRSAVHHASYGCPFFAASFAASPRWRTDGRSRKSPEPHGGTSSRT